MSTDRTDYPAVRLCPVHGVPQRRIGLNYYCPVTPADDERRRAAELAARLKWVADVYEVPDGEVQHNGR